MAAFCLWGRHASRSDHPALYERRPGVKKASSNSSLDDSRFLETACRWSSPRLM